MARIGLGNAWQCTFSNDIDPMKCAVYRKNFGDNELSETSIAEITVEGLPEASAELAWASFPCQDLSLAGNRAGINAERSGLFFDFWRLIENLSNEGRAPRSIVIENVAGLLTSNGGRDFERVLTALIEAGYWTGATVIDAAHFSPQSRKRLFIFGLQSPVHFANTDGFQDLSTKYNLPSSIRDKWMSLPTPVSRTKTTLSEIISLDHGNWDSLASTQRLLSMMSQTQKNQMQKHVSKDSVKIGTGFRRTRSSNGVSKQVFEARFDGLAGCLRTPAGGSSRQYVIVADRKRIKTRLMAPNEAAALMGLPPDYKLPDNKNAALKVCGDGVSVPVVRWISENILLPAIHTNAQKSAA